MRFPDKVLKIPESDFEPDFDPDSLLSLDPEPFLCFLASAYEKCKIKKINFTIFTWLRRMKQAIAARRSANLILVQ